MGILSFKIRKFKSDFPREKQLKNFLVEKASLPPKNLVFFSKKWYQKIMSSAASISLIFHLFNKHNQLVPNTLSKSLWEFYLRSYNHFKFESKEIEGRFPPRKMAQKFLEGNGVSAPQTLSKIFKKMESKNNDFRFKNMKNT